MVTGRILENIILLVTTKVLSSRYKVCKFQFASGEFDMVIADPDSLTCEIFEVKHSDKRDPSQRRHLLDSEKCARVEHRWGAIERKAVIYRGEPCLEEDVEYLNVEEYLKCFKTAFSC